MSWRRTPQVFSAYKDAYVKIAELVESMTLEQELKKMLEERSKPKPSTAAAQKTGQIENEISENSRKLDQANRKAADLRNQISGMLMPLERTAKKFDYIKNEKAKLYDYLIDINKISSSYGEFLKMLESMEAMMRERSIELKNPEEVMEKIKEIRSRDLKSTAAELKGLESERDSLSELSRMYNRISLDEKDMINAEKAGRERLEKLSSDLSGLGSRKKALKGEIERMFLDNYRKRIELLE